MSEMNEVERIVSVLGGCMRVTKEMVERASIAYAGKRHPTRWDGEPWGEAGRRNHEAAIRAALEVILSDYRLERKDVINK